MLTFRCSLADPKRSNRRNLRIEALEERRLLSSSATNAVNSLGLDLYQHMQHEEGNLFFSPLSISAGLAMTYAGADGQTAVEMQDTLHLGTEPGIHSSFGDLLSTYSVETQLDPGTSTFFHEGLSVSNAIWPQAGAPVNSEFVDTIQTEYDGHAQTLNYGNSTQAKQTINDWVRAATRGRIEELVESVDSATAMVLTNTVYFNSLWSNPFDPEHTREDYFVTADGEQKLTSMMYSEPYVSRTQIDGFDIVSLPYDYGDTSMVLFMPLDEADDGFVTSDTLDDIGEWLDSSPYEDQVQILLPKFTTTVDTGLNSVLAGLGMPTAFDGGADFSNMIDGGGIFIEKVFHKATITVNEQGTEAAAATEVQLSICFAAGTPVMTPSGEKAIEDLLVGDTVLARNEHNIEGEVEPKVIEQTKHGEANLLELHVGGKIIRTTELHPFFVYKQGWTPAGKIESGDRLATDGSGWVVVDKVVDTGKSEAVFNLRVADHHTFFIGGKSWGFGIWTHNFYDSGFYATRPFHYMIRDNATSTITFMGRVDDPTQLQNSIDPAVDTSQPIAGDYNADGTVDNGDYSTWRAAYGEAGTGLPADGNNDGIVNAADYTVWQDNLGSTAPPVAVVEAAGAEATDSALTGNGSRSASGALEMSDSPSQRGISDRALAALSFHSWPEPILLAASTPRQERLTVSLPETQLLLLAADAASKDAADTDASDETDRAFDVRSVSDARTDAEANNRSTVDAEFELFGSTGLSSA